MKSYDDNTPSTKALDDKINTAKRELNITAFEARQEIQELIDQTTQMLKKRVLKETRLNVLSLILILGIIGFLVYKTIL